MILDNAKQRIDNAIDVAKSTKEKQEIKFIYSELLTHDTITSVFDYIFKNGVEFKTKYEEFRFVVIVYPKLTT